jgi:hypothetical protein
MQFLFPDCIRVAMQETVTLLYRRRQSSNVAALAFFRYDSRFFFGVFATPEKWPPFSAVLSH